jgi:hypothetical protein
MAQTYTALINANADWLVVEEGETAGKQRVGWIVTGVTEEQVEEMQTNDNRSLDVVDERRQQDPGSVISLYGNDSP